MVYNVSEKPDSIFLYPDDGSSRFPRNAGKYLPACTAADHRIRVRYPWKHVTVRRQQTHLHPRILRTNCVRLQLPTTPKPYPQRPRISGPDASVYFSRISRSDTGLIKTGFRVWIRSFDVIPPGSSESTAVFTSSGKVQWQTTWIKMKSDLTHQNGGMLSYSIIQFDYNSMNTLHKGLTADCECPLFTFPTTTTF